jgi:hypothetical protein
MWIHLGELSDETLPQWLAKIVSGFRKQVADPTQNEPVDSQKWHPIWLAPSQHDDLLFEH